MPVPSYRVEVKKISAVKVSAAAKLVALCAKTIGTIKTCLLVAETGLSRQHVIRARAEALRAGLIKIIECTARGTETVPPAVQQCPSGGTAETGNCTSGGTVDVPSPVQGVPPAVQSAEGSTFHARTRTRSCARLVKYNKYIYNKYKYNNIPPAASKNSTEQNSTAREAAAAVRSKDQLADQFAKLASVPVPVAEKIIGQLLEQFDLTNLNTSMGRLRLRVLDGQPIKSFSSILGRICEDVAADRGKKPFVPIGAIVRSDGSILSRW